jgi:hypothetical protein
VYIFIISLFLAITKLTAAIAKKEDDPEQALKEFRAIVDKEEEKGDWCVQMYCPDDGIY